LTLEQVSKSSSKFIQMTIESTHSMQAFNKGQRSSCAQISCLLQIAQVLRRHCKSFKRRTSWALAVSKANEKLLLLLPCPQEKKIEEEARAKARERREQEGSV
jgi:hypothetical protein